MSRKASHNSIRSADESWSLDTRNGLPYSGESVQRYVRSALKDGDNKYGASLFDSNTSTMLYFRNVVDKEEYIIDTSRTDLIIDAEPINLTSNTYRVFIQNSLPSYNIQAATNMPEVILSMTFDVQTKQITDTVWTSTGDGVTVKAFIDRGATGVYTEFPVGGPAVYVAGSTVAIDVREYLANGSNRVKVEMRSETDSSVFSSVVYNVTMTEIYIEEFNNGWYNAIVEGVDTHYQLGGFRIVGAISKTLHIEIYRENTVVESFETLIGVSSYVDTPFYFTHSAGLDLSGLSTGVYLCRAYLTAGTLVSIPVSYNFMYVAEGDRFSAQLVCVNNVANNAMNYSTVALCNYAIYNCGQSSGTPHILVQLCNMTTPTTKIDADYPDVTTGIPHTLEYTIEWLIQETVNLYVYFDITIDGSSQMGVIPIDNSAVYPAEAGADFIMNASARTNNDANKESILNEATSPSSEILATWEKMSWIDGVDGWTQDDDGRRALLVPAFSKCTIPYRVMQGQNMTFELCFRVANVSNYNENIITAAENPSTAGFYGLRIRPTTVTLHSSADTDDSADILRSCTFKDERVVHLMVVIQTNYDGNSGKNLATMYLNGCENKSFSFDSGSAWENNANLIIGSDSADVYIYHCRVYRKALGMKAVEQNFINSLRTLSERAATSAWFNSVVNENTHELLIDKVINSDYNYFVVEMKDGATIPSRANGWAKDSQGYSDFEMHFGKHPEWDFKLFDVETTGQGTTSMDYYLWNLRFRIDKSPGKKVPVAYYDEPTVNVEGNKQYNIRPETLSSTVWFDGGGNGSEINHPAVRRITAKINFASSMQSHKIGATRAFHDLQQALGINNEAQEYAKSMDLPLPRTAVYQYPAFGFSKTVTLQGVPVYEFIGLFTIGPDKKDKGTFGYDINDSIKNSLITLEGTDHSRRMAKFDAPWNSDVSYLASNECLNIIKGNNDYDNGWEVGNCTGYSTDDIADQANINASLIREFKPAYDAVYNNSTLIFGIELGTYGATAADTLSYINSHIETFRSTAYNDRFTYADMEFWIEGEYVLYHFDVVTGLFVAGATLDSSIATGSTVYEQNEQFKQARRANFKANAPLYWDIKDSIFHYIFLIAFGITDNFVKNTYPYKMKFIQNNGLWKWGSDDDDSMADLDNKGTDSKPYYIEFTDAENGSTYFAGSTSVFWNLLYEVFWDDYGTEMGIESFGKEFISAMATLGGGSNIYEGCMNFWKKYFWDNAQEYFPPSSYNIDAAYKYKRAWLANGQAVDPLSQSLGNHYLAEMSWASNRIIYVMSLFKCGPFGSYSDVSMGQIAFRPQSLEEVTLTPSMWMYPALANGAGSPETTARTPEGEEHTFTGPFGTDGQTTFYIQASNYLKNLGNWKDLKLAAQYIDAVTINAAKLTSFVIGDVDSSEVSTNIPMLNFRNTKCLETIDARNATSLTGALNLEACSRLISALVEGTSITQVVLKNGSKIIHLHLSDATNTIRLKNIKFLTDLVLPSDAAIIRTLQIENCGNQNGLSILRSAYNATNAQLQFIRIILDSIESVSASDVSMLSSIADNKRKDGTSVIYRGMSANGDIEGSPVIEGTVQVSTNAGMYLSDLDSLGVVSIEDYGQGLKRAICSAFGPLNIIYDPTKLYVPFADPYVKAIMATQFGDGIGLLYSDVEGITTLANVFRNNTDIESFEELNLFVELTPTERLFENCSSLQRVTLPAGITTISNRMFNNCAALVSIGNIPNTVTTIEYNAFYNCASLQMNLILPTGITHIGWRAFSGCTGVVIENLYLPELVNTGIQDVSGMFKGVKVRHITSLGSITHLASTYNDGAFQNCDELVDVVLPQGITYLGHACFSGCTSLQSINLPTSIERLGQIVFKNCTQLVIQDLNLPNLYDIDTGAFGDNNTNVSNKPSIVRVTSLGTIASIPGNPSGQGLFRGITSLLSVVVPPTVTEIGYHAFRDCSSLETVDLSSCVALASIKSDAFRDCSSLVGDNTSPSRQVLNIPASITSIEQNVFYNCNSLLRIRIHATTPPTINANTFANNKSIIEVPSASLTAYEQATYWSSVNHKITMIGGDIYYDISTGGTDKALAATSSGPEVPAPGYSISDYIHVTGGNDISVFAGNVRNFGLIEYDSNNNVIASHTLTGSAQTITLDSSAASVRTTFITSEIGNRTMYVKDATTSTCLWPLKR